MTEPRTPVISLWQPYASLIFTRRLKRHETRSWALPSHRIGQRIAIHAAQKKPSRAFLETDLGHLCTRQLGAGWRDRIPYGAIIGTVTLANCYPTERGPDTEADYLAGDWTPGRYAFRLEDAVARAEPLVIPGRQGWWSVPRDLLL